MYILCRSISSTSSKPASVVKVHMPSGTHAECMPSGTHAEWDYWIDKCFVYPHWSPVDSPRKAKYTNISCDCRKHLIKLTNIFLCEDRQADWWRCLGGRGFGMMYWCSVLKNHQTTGDKVMCKLNTIDSCVPVMSATYRTGFIGAKQKCRTSDICVPVISYLLKRVQKSRETLLWTFVGFISEWMD